MKVFPSTSVTVAPCALAMKRGVPPTERKARTGEFTPPGITFFAARNSFFDRTVESFPTRFASPGSGPVILIGRGKLGEFYPAAPIVSRRASHGKRRGFPRFSKTVL